MKKIFRLLLLVAVLMAAFGAISCSSTPSKTDAEIAAIRAYADPATTTTLQGLSENNLAKYVQNGDAQFKAAVTQSIMDKVSSQVTDQLGSFVSITYLIVEEQDVYVIVHYKAIYTKGDVGVRMVFDKDHLVAGQFFE